MNPLREKIVEAVIDLMHVNHMTEDMPYNFEKQLTDAIDKAIGEQGKQDNWISVGKEQPTKYGKYLCYTKNEQRTIEVWNGTGWAYHHEIITHWQPLPNPPKTEADGK